MTTRQSSLTKIASSNTASGLAMTGALILALVLGTVIILLHQKIVTGHFFTDLSAIADYRLSASAQPYSNGEWLHTLFSRAKAFFWLATPSHVNTRITYQFQIKRSKISFINACNWSLPHFRVSQYHLVSRLHALPFNSLCRHFHRRVFAKSAVETGGDTHPHYCNHCHHPSLLYGPCGNDTA